MKPLLEVAEISISYLPVKSSKPKITSALDAFVEIIDFYPPELIGLQEQFLVMYLNRAKRVLGIYSLSKGGITGTVADVRLIMGVALKTAANAIILSHNHPSGSLSPSIADIEITKQIVEAGKLMQIEVMDHLIVSAERKYFSFSDEGLM